LITSGASVARDRSVRPPRAGLGVGVDQPVQQHQRVDVPVGHQSQGARQNRFLQRVLRLAQLLQRLLDPGPVRSRIGQRLGDPHRRQPSARCGRQGVAHPRRRQQRRRTAHIERQRPHHQIGRTVP
jgi:hypothetical protein